MFRIRQKPKLEDCFLFPIYNLTPCIYVTPWFLVTEIKIELIILSSISSLQNSAPLRPINLIMLGNLNILNLFFLLSQFIICPLSFSLKLSLKKLTQLLGDFGGQVCRKKIRPIPLLIAPGMIFASQLSMVALEQKIWSWWIKAVSFTVRGILPPIKILCFLLSSKLSTTHQPPSGMPPTRAPDPCFGPQSCKLDTTSIPMLFIKFIMVTHPFGRSLGALFGTMFTSILFCLLSIHLCLLKSRISGFQKPRIGTISFYPPPSMIRLSKPLKQLLLLPPTAMIFSDGLRSKMVSALPNLLTPIFPTSRFIISSVKEPKA